MFAGYSAQVDGMKANLNEYIAYHCSHAISQLANQIEIALGYMDEKHTDKETLRADAEGIASRFATTIPRIQEILLTDVQAGFDGDPAAKSKEEIIFCYPGFFAIFVYFCEKTHTLFLVKLCYMIKIWLFCTIIISVNYREILSC